MNITNVALGGAIGAFVAVVCSLAGVTFWPMIALAFLASLIVSLIVGRL